MKCEEKPNIHIAQLEIVLQLSMYNDDIMIFRCIENYPTESRGIKMGKSEAYAKIWVGKKTFVITIISKTWVLFSQIK